MPDTPNLFQLPDVSPDTYVVENFKVADLSPVFLLKHSAVQTDSSATGYLNLQPQHISVNYASFIDRASQVKFPQVNVRLQQQSLILSCRCGVVHQRLCEHQSRLLYNLMNRTELRIFFDEQLRTTKLKAFAAAYGLEKEKNLDSFFALDYDKGNYKISPLIKDLLPVTPANNSLIQDILLPKAAHSFPKQNLGEDSQNKILVLKQHRYYSHFQVELMECALTSTGKIRNPLSTIDPMEYLWATTAIDELKFYTAITKFQQNYEAEKPELEIEGLKALIKNPLELDVYYHDQSISANLTVSAIVAVKLKNQPLDINLSVDFRNGYYTITGELILDNKAYDLNLLNLKYKYFILYSGTMHLIDKADFLRVIEFFRQNNNHLVIHESKFASFQQDILSKLEHRIHITYSYLKAATKEQLKESHFDSSVEKILYLSDPENFILLTPVIKYGNIEVPVLSRKQISAIDQLGNEFKVSRNEDDEFKFISTLTRQHPDFEEQQDKESFYLHKKRFLDEAWFFGAFEEWQSQGITILGFNELKGNQINPNKAKISISVVSGLNWFDSHFEVKFGQQKVSLKHLHRSIRNKSKFVKLGDGTLGLLPKEWIDKLSGYFNAGEIEGDLIRTAKVNFGAIDDLYEDEVLSEEVKMELASFRDKIAAFQNISQVEVPPALNATLRTYQKEGLNWLNFLDEFEFGGCLADDMGLGKTIQIIAFILSQRDKGHTNTNLIVVPTTLIFNWQSEIAKFAPDIKVLTIHGAERNKHADQFSKYEIVLTTYGTLLYDIAWLKKYKFNYVFLDESQTIKNPESLRYRAACLLQSRNKITLTGTPIENNTFDLYGQLSFACPGLLGSKQFFRDHYSTPIDRFKDNRRAVELKKKVSPFILRRTKKEVAMELPDKTEMVIYCELGNEQKNAYDACKNEYIKFLQSEKEEDIPKHSLHILKGLTQLRQICNSPALLKDDMLHSVASSKINVLLEEIQNHSPKHKILVFSQFVSMLDLIKKELLSKNIDFEYLTGQSRNRAAKVENFQQNEEVRVFLISLKAGGTGLNLTEADYVYLVDPWWNPAAENQAIDRSHRIGQKKNVVAVRLICPDTIEEKIMKLQETKKELINDIIQTDGAMLRTLSKSDLLSLFS